MSPQATAPRLQAAEVIETKVLETTNNSKFTLKTLRTVIIAGVGFFTDAYDLFVINICANMIGLAWYPWKYASQGPTSTGWADASSWIKASAIIGTFFGQTSFGYIADVVGRKRMYGVELGFMCIGTFLSAFAADTKHGITTIGTLCMWRGVLGFGVGGDYPLSAVITSEYSSTSRRGRMISAVKAMQGFGELTAAIVCLVMIEIYKPFLDYIVKPTDGDYTYVDQVWRWCLGLGMVPAVCTIYFRVVMPETPRFSVHVTHDADLAADAARYIAGEEAVVVPEEQVIVPAAVPRDEEPQVSHFTAFCRYFRRPRNCVRLIGCCTCWFFYDMCQYGLGLNDSVILTNIGFLCNSKTTCTIYDTIHAQAAGKAIITLMGKIPGYWLTVLFVDVWGRKPIQFMGFAMNTAIFACLAAFYFPLKDKAVGAFMFLYALAQLFFQFGPGVTTFVIPGEAFPTRFRTTAHGLAAASGKIGAVISTFGFDQIVTKAYLKADGTPDKSRGIQLILAIFSGLMFLGFLCTIMVPETLGKSLEELGEENEEEQGEEAQGVKMSSLNKGNGVFEEQGDVALGGKMSSLSKGTDVVLVLAKENDEPFGKAVTFTSVS